MPKFSGTSRIIARRILVFVPTFLVATILLFVLLRIMPGDPARMGMGVELPPEQVEMIRERLGLNRPLYVQYLDWLSGVVRGDFGETFASREEISVLLARALPRTLTYNIFSLTLAILLGIPAGIITALKKDSLPDLVVSLLSFVSLSVPAFWLGMLSILLFSVMWGILPAGGYVDPLVDPIEGMKHLLMPSLMLATGSMAGITRLTRSSLLEVLLQDYITAARAKGLSERVIIYKHALKNAMIPVLTVLGVGFGSILGGSVILEQVFSIPGMGALMYHGVFGRSYNIVLACGVIAVTMYLSANLIVDILYVYLNPLVRYK